MVLRAGDQLQVPPSGIEVSGDTVEAFARDAALGGAVSRGVNVDPLAQEYGKIHQAIDDVMRNDALSDEQKRASVGAIVQSASHYTANMPEADRVRASEMLAGVAYNADWRTRDLGATSAGIGSAEGLPQMAGHRGMQLHDPDGTLWEHNGNTWRQVSGNERTLQSRRVGDTIYHVQTTGRCATAECVMREANVDYTAPENADYVSAVNAKGREDAANVLTAGSLLLGGGSVVLMGRALNAGLATERAGLLLAASNTASRGSLTTGVGAAVISPTPENIQGVAMSAISNRLMRDVAVPLRILNDTVVLGGQAAISADAWRKPND